MEFPEYDFKGKTAESWWNSSMMFAPIDMKLSGNAKHMIRKSSLLEITARDAARVKEYVWPRWALRQTDEDYIEIVLLRK